MRAICSGVSVGKTCSARDSLAGSGNVGSGMIERPSYNRTAIPIDGGVVFCDPMMRNEDAFPGGVQVTALIALLAGAAGSVAFMLRAGQKTPPLLLVTMIAWVL